MGDALRPSPKPATSKRRSAPLAPFARPLFAGVWLANTVSNFGGQVQAVGAAWLMTSLTTDPSTISLVTGAGLAPMLLFSLVAGAVADAVDRRLVLLVAQLGMFAASIALTWLTAAGRMTPTALVVLTFLIGTGFAFNAPAWQATVRQLVPPTFVPAAISLNVAGWNLSRTAGPALGGLVVAWGGPQTAFALNAVSYIGLLLVLASWLHRPSAAPEPDRQPMLQAIRAGLRHVADTGEMRRIVLRVTAFGLPLGALMALIPIIVRHLGAGPGGMGLVFGCSGGGAVLGAFAANPLRTRLGVEPMLCGGTVAVAAAMAVVGWSDRLLLTACAEVVSGFAATMVYVTLNLLMQVRAPRALLGRVLSIQQMAALGGLAVGAWLWGEVADMTGAGSALLIAAAAMASVLLLNVLQPLANLAPDFRLERRT